MLNARGVTLVLAIGLLTGCTELLGPGSDGYPLLPEVADAQLSEPERLQYEEDAVRLAIRHLVETDSPARDDVRPPPALVASLYRALVHVHLSSHPARDSVVDRYAIHTFPEPATREVMVRVDPQQTWTHAWKALNATTGNAAVDALVTEYALSVREYYRWEIGEVAVLRAASPLNATALAARFEGIPGVIWAERNGAGGDGHDIRATRHGDGWRLDYSIGFGDCPAGCIHRYTWSFSVSAAGEVSFLGTSGQAP